MSLLECLGKKRLLGWAVEFSLALCLIFSLFYLAGYFGLSFFVLSNRGMVEHIVSGSVVSASLDPVVWGGGVFVVLAGLFYGLGSGRVGGLYRFLAGFVLCGLVGLASLAIFGLVSLLALVVVSVLIVSLCFVFSFGFFGVSRFGLFKGLLIGGILIVLFVEVASLVLYNAPVALNLSPQLSGAGLHWNLVELSFSNLAYPFLPYAYLLFVLMGIVGFIVKVVPGRLLISRVKGEFFLKFVCRLRGIFDFCWDSSYEFRFGSLGVLLAVLVSVVVSCLFVVFTVLPWVNPTNMLVSVDSPGYYQWIVYMRSVDVNSAFSFAFANDRTLFLLLAYVLSFVFGAVGVVQFVSGLLVSLFCVACLLVLRFFVGLHEVWVFGVLLVPFSFQALGLIYAGYFASMLALVLVLLYFVVFLKVVRCWSNLGVFGLLVLSVLILFSHSWTWFVFVLSLVGFLFLEWRSARQDDGFRLKAVLVGGSIGVALVCDFARRFLSTVSSSVSVFTTASTSLGFPNVSFLLSGLRDSVYFSLGGVFANQLLVFLSILGFLVLLRYRSTVSNFLVSWVFVVCMLILFASSDFVFDRVLFLLPSVVLSGFGLSFIVRFFVGGLKGSNRFLRLGILILVLCFVFLVLLNGALRYVLNINVW
jgi:hypothetical protein